MRNPRRRSRHLIASAGIASAAIAGIATPGLGAAAAAGGSACTPVPRTIPAGRLLQSGTKLKVHIGSIVYAVNVEPEKYITAGYPSGFPWRTTRASNTSVLRTVAPCKRTGASTLPSSVAAFRASHAGTSAVSAPLATNWRSVKHAPAPFHATVTVAA